MDARLAPSLIIPGVDGSTIGDFWSWAYSDVLCNTTRGVFAEFLVAAALGLTEEPRREWDAVDLRYGDYTIEVKSAAYCQTWEQKAPSPITFDIARKTSWDARTNTYDDRPSRSADCYVFCLFAEQDKDRAQQRVVDPSAWWFHIVRTEAIDSTLGDQKRVSLSRLESVARAVGYAGLRTEIDSVLEIPGQ